METAALNGSARMTKERARSIEVILCLIPHDFFIIVLTGYSYSKQEDGWEGENIENGHWSESQVSTTFITQPGRSILSKGNLSIPPQPLSCPPNYLSLSLSLSLSVCVSVSIYLSIYLCVSVSLCPFLSLTLFQFIPTSSLNSFFVT